MEHKDCEDDHTARKDFQQGAFIIVPMETASNTPQCYKLTLMDERRRNKHIIRLAGIEGTAIRWSDLDNMELQSSHACMH